MKTARVLMVGEDLSILRDLRRAVEADFHVETAAGAARGLDAIDRRTPFAVVVSDLRMTGMDGIQFLSHARMAVPDAIPVLLCWQNDLPAVCPAINRGTVYRLLTMPCSERDFADAVVAAADLYRRTAVEPDGLQRALSGLIGVLMEVLAVSDPELFRRSARIRWSVAIMGREARLRDAWQFETAALLSQIGGIGPDRSAAAPESRTSAKAQALLNRTPGLETVTEIVAAQHKPYRDFVEGTAGASSHVVSLGAEMLHIALALEQLTREGREISDAIAELSQQPEEYNPELLAAMQEAEETCDWQPASAAAEGESGREN